MTHELRLRLLPALAVVALLGGCNKVTGIVFTVDASGPVSGIARLHGTATLKTAARRRRSTCRTRRRSRSRPA